MHPLVRRVRDFFILLRSLPPLFDVGPVQREFGVLRLGFVGRLELVGNDAVK